MTVSTSSDTQAPARWAVWAAFAAIYLIWGSTYIGIRFAVETIPPFLMGGSRFMMAGLLMMVWALARGAKWPTWSQWRSASIAGFVLFVLNNGALVWAAQHVPSGVLALLIAATPMWMVLLDWWRPSVHGRLAGGARPTNMVFAGLLLGFFGILLLANPTQLGEISPNFAIGVVVTLIGSVAWAAGSLYARQADMPESPILSTALQLFVGGGLLLALGLASGQAAGFDLAQVTAQSAVSWVYLLIFGSIIGFGSYVWLLRVSTPARVSTYAYVNPVIAVFLGWLLADEPLTPRTMIAAAIIIGSVMLINSTRHRKQAAPRPALAEVRR